MNRKRCPWCGKRIDKTKDKMLWKDSSLGHFSMLHISNCAHCRHKYGQLPYCPYALKITLGILAVIVLGFVFQSMFLILGVPILCLLYLFIPYFKLDDKGKPCEENAELSCEMRMLEKYGEIKRDDLYFLTDSFDDFDPFAVASPIHMYYVSKKSDTLLGEFLYMHEQNYDFISQESCALYDTEMNMVAKIKFVTDENS